MWPTSTAFNTHGVVFDELHTQPNRKLFDVMTKGSGDARMQPLVFPHHHGRKRYKHHLL
jgi:phage terminase large subunit-like protein